ncbi:hypothetical protein [Streptomyces sp. NPDC005283]|uniref:hypothetical protein n=1 Tax=Streptomyces sp. NPDC005283 TaxID=3156871 RepID=UPI003456CFCD
MSNTVPVTFKPSGPAVTPDVETLNGIPAQPAYTPPTVTIDRLLDAPLPELIAETDVEVIESSITDEKFFGVVVARKGKRTLVMMRAGLSDIENDVITRYLIGQSLHMDLTPLPAPFETEFGPLLPGVPMGGKA